VLIAEDENTNYYLLESILKPLNVKILWAKNGLEAVEYIKTNKNLDKFIVLMDIKMPVMDGIEAFEEIRKINSKVPVYAVTAYATLDEKNEIMLHGFTDFYTKPIKTKQILQSITNL